MQTMHSRWFCDIYGLAYVACISIWRIRRCPASPPIPPAPCTPRHTSSIYPATPRRPLLLRSPPGIFRVWRRGAAPWPWVARCMPGWLWCVRGGRCCSSCFGCVIRLPSWTRPCFFRSLCWGLWFSSPPPMSCRIVLRFCGWLRPACRIFWARQPSWPSSTALKIWQFSLFALPWRGARRFFPIFPANLLPCLPRWLAPG